MPNYLLAIARVKCSLRERHLHPSVAVISTSAVSIIYCHFIAVLNNFFNDY
jgi:hypothetical protein